MSCMARLNRAVDFAAAGLADHVEMALTLLARERDAAAGGGSCDDGCVFGLHRPGQPPVRDTGNAQGCGFAGLVRVCRKWPAGQLVVERCRRGTQELSRNAQRVTLRYLQYTVAEPVSGVWIPTTRRILSTRPSEYRGAKRPYLWSRVLSSPRFCRRRTRLLSAPSGAGFRAGRPRAASQPRSGAS